MPTQGRLGKAVTAALAYVTVYTVPAAGLAEATVNVSICNTGAGPALVRLAITTGGAPAATDYLEFDYSLAIGEVLERTGIAMSLGEAVLVRSDIAGLSVRVHGYESI